VKSTPGGGCKDPETVRPRAVGAVKAVTACLLKNEPASCSVSRKVKGVRARSRSESESEEGVWWHRADPKPRELPMARVKVR
jgi:hypothetical protein